MAIYVKNKYKVSKIFANVNGSKKEIKSVWANKDGIATKVFSKSNPIQPFWFTSGQFFYKSDDLKTFTQQKIGNVSYTFSSVRCVPKDKLVIFLNKQAYYTTDGINFTSFDDTTSIIKNTPSVVIYANGMFLAYESTNIYTSTNGNEWVLAGTLPESFVEVIYANNKFVARLGDYLYQSDDGINFNKINLVYSGNSLYTVLNLTNCSTRYITYENGMFFCPVNRNTRIDAYYRCGISYSINGVDWNVLLIGGNNLRDNSKQYDASPVCYYDGKYYCLIYCGYEKKWKLYISTDGITWDRHPSTSSDGFSINNSGTNGVCQLIHTNDKFVANFYGYLYTSTDCINWTYLTSNSYRGSLEYFPGD